jgi:hypothetical protein
MALSASGAGARVGACGAAYRAGCCLLPKDGRDVILPQNRLECVWRSWFAGHMHGAQPRPGGREGVEQLSSAAESTACRFRAGRAAARLEHQLQPPLSPLLGAPLCSAAGWVKTSWRRGAVHSDPLHSNSRCRGQRGTGTQARAPQGRRRQAVRAGTAARRGGAAGATQERSKTAGPGPGPLLSTLCRTSPRKALEAPPKQSTPAPHSCSRAQSANRPCPSQPPHAFPRQQQQPLRAPWRPSGS